MKISEIFYISQLIDFNETIEECALELGLSEIVTPDTLYCLAKKKNLVDDEGGIKWDDAIMYRKKLIQGSNDIIDQFEKIIQQCREVSKEERNKFKGSTYKIQGTAMKFMECILPLVNYSLTQLTLF